MNTLLQSVFDAHGGLDRWRGLTTLTARISYGGPFWELKGRPDFVGTDRVEADLQTQRIRHYQESSSLTLDFDKRADRVTITDADGATVEKLDHPRRTFAGLTAYAVWSRAQTAYFRVLCDMALPRRALRLQLGRRRNIRDRAMGGGRPEMARLCRQLPAQPGHAQPHSAVLL
jgi:hypothetical protein